MSALADALAGLADDPRFTGGPCEISHSLVFESEAPTRLGEVVAALERIYGPGKIAADTGRGRPVGGSETTLRFRVKP